MKTKNHDRRERSGQIILVAVLAMALVLVSTQIYVFEVQLSTIETSFDSLNDHVLAVRFGSRNVVMGSVANISNGGSSNLLATNLERWITLVSKDIRFGKCVLNYTLDGAYPYSSGVWLFWGNNGYGVSSAFANFTFKLSDREANVNLSYNVNVTTTLLAQGIYSPIQGDEKQVNVTINLQNEGEPALAQQITLRYRVLSEWLVPNASNNYLIMDYGNGTYRASFQAEIPSPNVEVSIRVVDQRMIFVDANTTCSQV